MVLEWRKLFATQDSSARFSIRYKMDRLQVCVDYRVEENLEELTIEFIVILMEDCLCSSWGF